VYVDGGHEGELVPLPGQVELESLDGFDLSRVHTLALSYSNIGDCPHPHPLLPSCQQLRALFVRGCDVVLLQAAVLRAIAALPRLQHLHVYHEGHWTGQPDFSSMAVLMSGCRQLKQLILVAITGLQEGTVAALMMLPRLRLLRLLGCSPELSQERCQALVGQLRLYELQVDMVVDDGSARAEWMIRKLGRGGGKERCWSNIPAYTEPPHAGDAAR
jgi:hypothetical protein